MIFRRLMTHLRGLTPIFHLTMTTFCVLFAALSIYANLPSGTFAFWSFASGLWFSLLVCHISDHGRDFK